MIEERRAGSPSWNDPRGEDEESEDVATMLRLKACSWGIGAATSVSSTAPAPIALPVATAPFAVR
ncbi:MAG: hypothetical protein WC829_21210 [Hyphomicrobium sp.]|jgi:hypothetical protein